MSRRKSLTDLTTDPGPVPDLFQRVPEPEPGSNGDPDSGPSNGRAPAAEPSAASQSEASPKRRRRTAGAAPRSEPTPARPSARDMLGPARRSVVREALKADVPADLALIRRLHAYRLDKGVDIRDQVAIAVDEWLTSEGY